MGLEGDRFVVEVYPWDHRCQTRGACHNDDNLPSHSEAAGRRTALPENGIHEAKSI